MPYKQPRRGQPGRVVSVGREDPIPHQQSENMGRNVRRLRERKTPAESLFLTDFAARLHRRSAGEIRYVFQRDFLIGPGITFIVDFYFPQFKVAIELDGWQHLTEKGRVVDGWRGDVLAEYLGIVTVRFENRELKDEPERCWNALIAALLTNPNATPSYQRRLRSVDDSSVPYRWPDGVKSHGVYARTP